MLWQVHTTSGNCMFHAVRRGLNIRHSLIDQGAPYFPARYLRRMVAIWMINTCQQVMKAKGLSLRAHYGVEGGDAYHEALSFKEYCIQTLDRQHWGEDIHLYAISKMFDLFITVLNGPQLLEHRVHGHDVNLNEVDLVLIYNGSTHYHAAGEAP